VRRLAFVVLMLGACSRGDGRRDGGVPPADTEPYRPQQFVVPPQAEGRVPGGSYGFETAQPVKRPSRRAQDAGP
jgi:hypothetical protein